MSFSVSVFDYENMFEWAPISLWLEDYSAIKQLFDGWRGDGVTDLVEHFRQHPVLLRQCAQQLRVIKVNRKTLQVLGARDQDDLLARLPDIFRDEMLTGLVTELDNLWRGELSFSKETVNYTLDGRRMDAEIHLRVLPGHEANWSRVMVAFDDITTRKQIAAHLEYVSAHDALTGLYNRAFYTSELERIAQAGQWPLSVVTMDLNGLKRVNDAHGHAAGDALLRRIGDILRQARSDTHWSMVRTGGDEFAVLMPGCNETQAQRLITQIEALVAASNQTAAAGAGDTGATSSTVGAGYALSVSMGMASCDAGGNIDEALHQADQRMFAAKTLFYEMTQIERRRI